MSKLSKTYSKYIAGTMTPECYTVVSIVCRLLEKPVYEVISGDLKSDIVVTRMIAAKMVMEYLGCKTYNLSRIAEDFGKHHATILYYIKTIKDLQETDKRISKQITLVKEWFESNVPEAEKFRNDLRDIRQNYHANSPCKPCMYYILKRAC